MQQQKDFFKAQAAVNGTELLLERTQQYKDHEKAQQEFQSLLQLLEKSCTPDYQLALDEKGEPVCLAKPKQQTPIVAPK